MILAIAAAGRGVRLGKLGKKHPKPLFPVKGKPLLGHIFERTQRDLPISEVIVVRRGWSLSGRKIAGFAEDYCSKNKLRFHVVTAPTRGVGYAFYRAMQVAKALPSKSIVFSVADVLAESYTPLDNPDFQVTIGTVPYDARVRREWTPIESDLVGKVSFNSGHRGARMFHSQIGFYRLDKSVLPAFDEIISAGVENWGREPEKINQEKEMRVSWIWPKMHARGISIGAADLGRFAELTHPKDISRFDDLVD